MIQDGSIPPADPLIACKEMFCVLAGWLSLGRSRAKGAAQCGFVDHRLKFSSAKSLIDKCLEIG
jgi:hypothetical protein